MKEITYYLIEAFGNKPFTGNPAAVCILKEKLSHTVMQKIASQFNLSETAFVWKLESQPESHYEIRWFTPLCEVALCGHATLASARALWEEEAPGAPIHFTSKSGELVCKYAPSGIQLTMPKKESEHLAVPEDKLEPLFPKAVFFAVSEKCLIVEFSDATEVMSYEVKHALFETLPYTGIYITAKSEEDKYDFVSRCFFPSEGIPEDSVTGSAHCALGPYWAKKLGKNSLQAFQASARSGVLGVEVKEEKVILTGMTRIFSIGNIPLENYMR